MVGFLPAAVLTGWLASKGWDRNPLTAFATMLLGTVVLYAIGTVWFAQWANGTGLGWESTWTYAVQPFLLGDLIKIVAVVIVFPGMWSLMKR